ncbi:MAG: LysR family transcriptional regulator [Hahellaceae bacterium]|nr:LysR family transcriptional regulator [Anaerolineae bacterium]MCP5162874.1 LysR family transcriptional regulator [Hahellaceae bacterium]MCP5168927.1 LysR family transcriptional regulator [Hahellaceae bacterium]
MDLNHLKTFVVVAEEAHLTRAAERLFTSQPAVSAQIKALEEALGLSLFDRTPKGMRLTQAGERLLAQAQGILAAAGDMLSEAKALKGAVMGDLKLGVNSDCGFLQIPGLMAALREHHPNVHLTIENSMSPDILNDIRKGQLDGGFFFGDGNTLDLQVVPLADVPSAILAPVAWADRFEHASQDDLCGLPWIYSSERCPFIQIVEAMFGERAEDLTKVVYVNNEDAMREFVRSGNGIAFLRADDADRAVDEGWGVRWTGVTPPIRLSVATQARRFSEPLIKAWLEQLQALWPQADQGLLAKQSA